MRVISGSARGRMLDAVPGKNTRPTTDKVKESVFNILQFRLYDAAMLDLFAGTGQMGIEALSRGAARAVFVDQAPKAIGVIKKKYRRRPRGGPRRGFAHDLSAGAAASGGTAV